MRNSHLILILSVLSFRPQDRTVVCTICQLVVPVPAKGIEAFPLNFFINNMLTVLAVQNPTKCTNCEDSSQATARCLDCVENLCTNCVFAHKRIRQTKDHRILTFDEIQANEVKDIIRCPSFCSVHPREVRIKAYYPGKAFSRSVLIMSSFLVFSFHPIFLFANNM